jgi:hypothetical protein
MIEPRVDLILDRFSDVFEIIINALKEKDQKLALAATEFLSGIIAFNGD